MAVAGKTSWKIFLDLQCPFSKTAHAQVPALRARFGGSYEISTHLTSLAFHPQAFTAQCAATVVGGTAGPEARSAFEAACFERQESFMNAALGDARKSEVEAVFADIAQGAGVLSGPLSREDFLAGLHDWERTVKPAYAEHKVALGYGVYGTPKHVIGEALVPDTESAWGPDEWAAKLSSL
mmetsp:Transcript_47091/g.117905  ORF Transcript_47091/g.117905 Transcript_47091/m.117905 type:complete len:181 (-) Transcript_47091:13-555(-)